MRIARLLIPASLLAASLRAQPAFAADVCDGNWVPIEKMPTTCPAKDTCWVVEPLALLPPTRNLAAGFASIPPVPTLIQLFSWCEYQNVHFKIARSNTTFDCRGATLKGPIGKDESKGHYGITVAPMTASNESDTFSTDLACEAPKPADFCPAFFPLEDVTVRDCNLLGFDRAVRVTTGAGGAGGDLEKIYLDWFDHLNERKCRIDRIEDCLRTAGPHRVRFENVHALRAQVGFHLTDLITQTTIADSSSTRSGSTGIYLSPASRDNIIERTQLVDNFREGIALDSSANNIIRDSYFKGNGQECADQQDTLGDEQRCRSAITVFKNFWEAEQPNVTSRPRSQHASGNLIEGNEIIGHLAGVYIGLRQEKPFNPNDADRDPLYSQVGRLRYMRERAENTRVIDNLFTNNQYGVLAVDDGAVIQGNEFLGSGAAAVYLGSPARRAAREPVFGATVTGNVFANGLERSVHSAYCTVGNEISGNSGGPAPTSEACNFSRAVIKGSFMLDTGRFEAQSAYREAAMFEPGQTWLAGSFDGVAGDDLVNLFITADRRVRMWMHGSSNGGRLPRALNRSFDYQTGFQTFELAADIPTDGKWVSGQFTGDRGDDLVYLFRKDGGTCALAWYSYGKGFMFNGVRSDPHLPIESDQCFQISTVPWSAESHWLAGHRNLDGKTDLIQIYRDSAGFATAQSYISLDGRSFAEWRSPQRMDAFDSDARWLTGDFDGDGRSDLVSVFANSRGQATASVRLGQVNDFSAVSWTQTFASTGAPLRFSAKQHWLVGNFNGDAYDDLLFVYGRDGEARVWRTASNGARFNPAGFQTLGTFSEDQIWLSGRFDQNENADLVTVYGKSWESALDTMSADITARPFGISPLEDPVSSQSSGCAIALWPTRSASSAMLLPIAALTFIAARARRRRRSERHLPK